MYAYVYIYIYMYISGPAYVYIHANTCACMRIYLCTFIYSMQLRGLKVEDIMIYGSYGCVSFGQDRVARQEAVWSESLLKYTARQVFGIALEEATWPVLKRFQLPNPEELPAEEE